MFRCADYPGSSDDLLNTLSPLDDIFVLLNYLISFSSFRFIKLFKSNQEAKMEDERRAVEAKAEEEMQAHPSSFLLLSSLELSDTQVCEP